METIATLNPFELLEIISDLTPFILAMTIIILFRFLHNQQKYIEERLRLIDQKIIDCEQGIVLAHKFLSAVRQRAMDHGILQTDQDHKEKE